MKPAAGHRRSALGGEQQHREHAELLRDQASGVFVACAMKTAAIVM
jgi:hypothetical protein